MHWTAMLEQFFFFFLLTVLLKILFYLNELLVPTQVGKDFSQAYLENGT